MSIDCDQLAGRLRDICRGHDDNGNPVLTPQQCEAYRKHWARQAQGEQVSPASSDDPELACRHRSAEPVTDVQCELCGGKDRREPVYRCALHHLCTLKRYRRIGQPALPCCERCEDREATG